MATKKSGYISFYLSEDIRTEMSNSNKKVQFDLYTTMKMTTSDGGEIINGVNKALPFAPVVGQWNTYCLDINELSGDARFLIVQNAAAGDLYFDNFQLVD